MLPDSRPLAYIIVDCVCVDMRIVEVVGGYAQGTQ